jgi:hypothetical protein
VCALPKKSGTLTFAAVEARGEFDDLTVGTEVWGDDSVSSLIEHAKLWVLADTYLADALKDVCMYKLHRDLKYLAPCVVEDFQPVFELARYIYNQESTEAGDDDLSPQGGPRRLLLKYLVEKADQLVMLNPFRDLIGGGGSLAIDFAVALAKKNIQEEDD